MIAPPSPPMDYWAFGSFEFAAVGLIITLVAAAAGVLLFRAERAISKLERGSAQLGEQMSKINSTLIVTADLTLSNLPPITFTQQVPSDVMDTVSIIDDIFTGPHGNDLWASISRQPRAARLAYARAIYKFGSNPLSKENLLGGKKKRGENSDSVIALLDTALDDAEHRSRDPISLRRDILVRKSQALRQAGRYADAARASWQIARLYDTFKDIPSKYLAPWCLALAHLQLGIDSTEIDKRRAAFVAAATALTPPFQEVFESHLPQDIHYAGDTLTRYRQRWPNVELRSIAYYMAKSLWCIHFMSEKGEEDGAAKQRLRRALDLALLFYQNALEEVAADPQVSCSYHLCVPFLIAVKFEIDGDEQGLVEFSSSFPNLQTGNQLKEHAMYCLDKCSQLIEELRATQRPGEDRYIYAECTERLDTYSTFATDIDLVRRSLEGKDELAKFYKNMI